MNIVELNGKVISYGVICPLKNQWIVQLEGLNYCSIKPDGSVVYFTGRIYHEFTSKKLYILNEPPFVTIKINEGIDENGNLTSMDNAYKVEFNPDYVGERPTKTRNFYKWLNIKDDEFGILFCNLKEDKFSLLAVPFVGATAVNIVFSRDGQTVLITEHLSNRVIIMDNPVF